MESENVDIVDRQRKLILEYDGAYFHNDRIENDQEKTVRLTEAGWSVVRVRVAPLPLLFENDLSIEKPTQGPKKAVDAILRHLTQLGHSLSDVDTYLRGSAPKNSRAADRWLRLLRKGKQFAFEEFVEHLLEFREQHHHLRFKSNEVSPDGYRIGKQAKKYRDRPETLDARAQQTLDKIGFPFDYWEAHFSIHAEAVEALAAASKDGELPYPLPRQWEYKKQKLKLQAWAHRATNKRRNKGVGSAGGQMSRQHFERLDRIPGWKWSLRCRNLDQ